eukprot:GHVS01008708.1.p1 GENE.GHVS01008708.1~~GHVS01008708.1.p1  ORF type:complete len:249 (-),score=46.76 GHVS01008708.1:852-1598(-)
MHLSSFLFFLLGGVCCCDSNHARLLSTGGPGGCLRWTASFVTPAASPPPSDLLLLLVSGLPSSSPSSKSFCQGSSLLSSRQFSKERCKKSLVGIPLGANSSRSAEASSSGGHRRMMTVEVYPSPALRELNDLIEKEEYSTCSFQELVRDLFKLMYQKKGVGLAAPQVGINKQVMVVNVEPNCSPSGERVYCNPSTVESSNDKVALGEGCLSFPGVFVSILRARSVASGYLSGRREYSNTSWTTCMAFC